MSRATVCGLVNRVFEGSASAMMLSLLENEQLDEESHADLRNAIERYRKGDQK